MTYIKCSKIFVFSSLGQILYLVSGQSNYLASLMCFEVFFLSLFLTSAVGSIPYLTYPKVRMKNGSIATRLSRLDHESSWNQK